MQPQYLTKGRRQLVIAEIDVSTLAGTAQFVNNNSAVRYVVRGISLRTSPKTSGTTCDVYLVLDYIDTSYFAGTGDTASGENYVNPGEYIQFDWTSGPSGGQGLASVYYDEEWLVT